MVNKFKQAFEQLFCTKIGWVMILIAHIIVFMSMAPGGIFEVKNGSWPLYIGVPCTIILFLFGCLIMVFGIINTIKSIKNWFKNRKK